MLLDWGRGQELASPYSAPKSRGGSFERRKRQGLEPEMSVAGGLWHSCQDLWTDCGGKQTELSNNLQKNDWADKERSKEGGFQVCGWHQSQQTNQQNPYLLNKPTLDSNICLPPHFNSKLHSLAFAGAVTVEFVFHLVRMSMTQNFDPSLKFDQDLHQTGTKYLPNHPLGQNKSTS